ncbi:MAG: hypothetical protein C4334_05750 [Pyrinomonas sp.]|uniref:hypothetical protein n=1 Tax=Pyrinomonas sp. TaxID=2080306 RepID=UPI00332DAEAF
MAERVPRDPNKPTPPYEKPPKNCRPLGGDEIEAKLKQASHGELVTLLVKGWNAGFFRIYERLDQPARAAAVNALMLEAETSTLEIDDGAGWPPGGGSSGPTKSVAKKGAGKKKAKQASGKEASRTKESAKKTARKRARRRSV